MEGTAQGEKGDEWDYHHLQIGNGFMGKGEFLEAIKAYKTVLEHQNAGRQWQIQRVLLSNLLIAHLYCNPPVFDAALQNAASISQLDNYSQVSYPTYY